MLHSLCTSWGSLSPNWGYSSEQNSEFSNLHFLGTSWGFSIVGGAEPGSDRSPEPVHVLFVVPESPAAKVISDVTLDGF